MLGFLCGWACVNFYSYPLQVALARPILYSNWLSKDYLPVEQEELREYVQARLKVFYEEELDVPLVLFNEVLDHVLRIDRIFKQNQVKLDIVYFPRENTVYYTINRHILYSHHYPFILSQGRTLYIILLTDTYCTTKLHLTTIPSSSPRGEH